MLSAAQAAVSVSPTFNYVATDGGGGGYEAFPDVTRLQDGRLMTVFYEGYTHISPPTGSYPNGGRIMYTTSANEGVNWNAPSVLYDSPIDDRDPSIAHSPYLLRTEHENLILMAYRGYNTMDGSGMGFTALRYSLNECATWSDPIMIDSCVGAYASMVNLNDGSVLVTYYEEGGGSNIRSRVISISGLPEPSGIVLLATALVGGAWYGWRKFPVLCTPYSVLRTSYFSQFFLTIVISFGLSVFGWQSAAQAVAFQGQVLNFEEREIYHSPETPGYTSWVGLWQLPDGSLRCDCHQLSGPKDQPVSTVPLLESRDGAVTWMVVNDNRSSDPIRVQGFYQLGKDSCRGMAVLPEGTLVRPVVPLWPPGDGKDSGYVQRSTDNGKTWSEKIYFLPPEEYRCWATLIRPLRDGRLVLFAGCWKRGDTTCGTRPDTEFKDGMQGMLPNMTKMMFLSSDEGKTWSKPIVLMPTEVGVCEESDFCELPNGDLFWIHRTEHYPDHETAIPPLAARAGANPPDSYWYSDRLQNIVRKQGDKFVPDKCESAPFPHSGYPSVLLTREGVILHLATGESHWSTDLGKTWHKLLVGDKPLGTHYYPKTIQLADGRIVCIGHRGSDDVYGTVDQAIAQQTFRLKVQ